MFQLTGFQRDLLCVIAGLDQPSGQAIKEELEDDFEMEINHGRLYPNLDTLTENEYVEKGEIDRRTNYYQLTESGEEVLRNRREWENNRLREVISTS